MDKARIQELMQWLKSTTTETVVEETVQLLQNDEDEDHLWSAAALTAARYVNNQAHNMLGFVSHAMIGAEDARRLASNQDTLTRHFLIVQALYQVVFDIHDPCMGPYELLPVKGVREDTVAENIRLLRMDSRIGEYSRCDHRFVTLAEDLPRETLINLLLEIGMEGMTTDDHTIISPVLCLGMIELVGWADGFEMLRGTMRYNASFPRDFEPHDRALALREQYGLADGAPGSGFDPSRTESIRQAFLTAAPAERPELAAGFMAAGDSPETVLSAVSLAGCDMYLMADPVPHEDFDAISREVAPIHIGTCISALRAGMQYMNPANQVLAVIRGGSQLERGPSVLNEVFEFVPFEPARPYPYAEDVAALADQSPEQLLNTLHDALYAHDYRTATAAVKAYEQTGAAPEALIALLTQVACTDSITILHSFKHLNSMVKEFYMSQHPDRWQYLIAAARFIAWYAGVQTDVYERARAALDAVPG